MQDSLMSEAASIPSQGFATDHSIGRVVDDSPLGALFFLVCSLCVLMSLLDGLDSQSISVVAPLMSTTLSLSPKQMGVFFSISQLGAAIGAMTFGSLGDRLGRRPMILLAAALVAVFTYLTAVTTSFPWLLAVRLAAGLGLGGAMPLVMALASEYAPTRLRGAVVTTVFAGYPLGGALGGVANAQILDHFTWQMVFYLGSAAPAAVFLLCLALLPESIQHLFLEGRVDQAMRLLRRIHSTVDSSPPSVARPSSGKRHRAPIGDIFIGRMAFATVLVWGLYLFSFATLKVMTTWFPTLVKQAGFSVQLGSYALGAFNLGAAGSMALAGYLTDRFGAFRALAPALVAGAISIFLLRCYPNSAAMTIAMATLIGVFVGAGGSGANAVAAQLYRPEIRSTGLGLGVAVSRFGQVLSPLLISYMLAAGLGAHAIYGAVALMPLVAAAFVIGLALWH